MYSIPVSRPFTVWVVVALVGLAACAPEPASRAVATDGGGGASDEDAAGGRGGGAGSGADARQGLDLNLAPDAPDDRGGGPADAARPDLPSDLNVDMWVAAPCISPDPMDLLSDFGVTIAGGELAVKMVNGRSRTFWASSGDGTATATSTLRAEMPNRCSSLYAMHFSGSGYTNWGVVANAPFVLQSGTNKFYDGTVYTGIRFFAKAAVKTRMTVSIGDKYTVGAGNYCNVATDAGAGRCGDHFSMGVDLLPDWQMYTVRFDQLKQGGWGVPQSPNLRPDQAFLWGMQISFGRNVTFDAWIDDISFVK